MIAVYPMLVSRAVSENIVPGLAKTIEGYIIVNAKDSIITNPEIKRRLNFKIQGGKLIAREGLDLSEGSEGMFGDRTKPAQTVPDEEEKARKAAAYDAEEKRRQAKHDREEAKNKRDQEKHDAAMADRVAQAEKDREEKIKKQQMDDAKSASASVKISDNKALSIEPSVVEIEVTDKHGNKRNESFGVKVIPFRVKSDAKLSRLILHDTQLKWFNALMVRMGRNVIKTVWRFIDRWSGNMKLGGLTPSGDPRRDLIMGRTGHKGEGFVVLSKTEDIDDLFLNNIKKINRLFKMGWGNIIIVDDVNRMAYFCMKQFKGVCTAISYSMIYQNFGQLKVYDSLEDAKRQTSSIFKIRKQLSRVVAEWVTEYRQVKYLSEDKKDG